MKCSQIVYLFLLPNKNEIKLTIKLTPILETCFFGLVYGTLRMRVTLAISRVFLPHFRPQHYKENVFSFSKNVIEYEARLPKINLFTHNWKIPRFKQETHFSMKESYPSLPETIKSSPWQVPFLKIKFQKRQSSQTALLLINWIYYDDQKTFCLLAVRWYFFVFIKSWVQYYSVSFLS